MSITANGSDDAERRKRSALSAGKPKRARKRTLRVKFLALNLCVALVPTILLFLAWEYFSYATSLEELEEKVDEVAAIQSEILGAPVWNLETDRIELILHAILKDNDFFVASVTDEKGNELAHRSLPQGDYAFHNTITTTSAIRYKALSGELIIGELTLVATDAHIVHFIYERLYLDLFIILLWFTAAACAAWIAFRRTIETPLSLLLQAINRSGKKGKRKAVEWKSNDEIGLVVSEFNDMQARQERNEAELEAARSNLEKRVRERTEELVKARDEADAANNAKSEFLAVMSHELRTPLNGIIGLAQSLQQTELGEEQQHRVELIRDSGWTLLELLNGILDLAKIETGNAALEILEFPLSELVSSIAELWSGIVSEKDIHFRLELPEEDLPVLKTDPTRLRQIIQNLLSNAAKFTDKGEICLRVVCEPAANDRVCVRFEVHDTGVGIDPDVRDMIFERFTQADASITRRFGGSGLGLSICREFANLMGGDIGVESEVGKGSCFWFTIECEKVEAPGPDAAEQRGAGQPAKDVPSSTLKLLVAEDNRVNRLVIKCIIESFGYVPHLVQNGREAIDALQQGKFDVVLMDVQMPVLDGISATTEIRKMDAPFASIPIIALTANAMQGDRERYMECGFTEYVSKPIDAATLHAALQRCVRDDATAKNELVTVC